MFKQSRSIALLVVLSAATFPVVSAAPIGSNPPPPSKKETVLQMATTVVQVIAQLLGMK